MKAGIKAWLNAVVLVIVLVVNYISSTGAINGTNQEQMSNKYLTPITPAPFTFSIWGVVYTLVLITIIMLIVDRKKESHKALINTISPLFWLTSLLNIGWIVTFLYDQVLVSTLLILALTVVLVLINREILKDENQGKNIFALTFGLYNGWLLVATIVNIAAYLVKIDWNRWGLSEEMWGILLLSVAFVLAIVLMMALKNAAIPLPAAWACFGIYSFVTSPDGFNGAYPRLMFVALLYLIGLGISALVQFKVNHWKVIPAPQRKVHF